MSMKGYSLERRTATLKQLLPPHNRTVAGAARQEGIFRARNQNRFSSSEESEQA